jgi:hypothetical protein
MSDLAIYDMDRTVTRHATYTPFLLHCALRRAPWRLLLLPIVALSMLAYGTRLIEGVFMRRFGGMHIHVWRPIDSKFRLVTARRNPNMVILVAALLVGRPDSGLVLVAWWTIVSLIFHAVRYAQASERAARGQKITSWLEA